jgi:hypothetical protein
MREFIDVCCVFFAIAGPILLVTTNDGIVREYHSTSWPTAEGTVKQTVARPQRQSLGNLTYSGRVLYRYRVENHEYLSDETYFGAMLHEASREHDIAWRKIERTG